MGRLLSKTSLHLFFSYLHLGDTKEARHPIADLLRDRSPDRKTGFSNSLELGEGERERDKRGRGMNADSEALSVLCLATRVRNLNNGRNKKSDGQP